MAFHPSPSALSQIERESVGALTSMTFAFTSPAEFNDLVYALMGRDPSMTLEEAVCEAEYAAAATDICCAPDAEGDRIDAKRNYGREF